VRFTGREIRSASKRPSRPLATYTYAALIDTRTGRRYVCMSLFCVKALLPSIRLFDETALVGIEGRT